MASSSSSQDVPQENGKECPYPYPSNLSATSFISLKLSGRDEYEMWKTQMLCLLKSHDMFGFIDGTFKSPQTSFAGKAKSGDGQNHSLWTRSDSVVKGWILGSLSKQTLGFVLNRVTKKLHQGRNADDFSAKDVWDELRTIYGPSVLPHRQAISGPPLQDTFHDPPPQQIFNGPPPQQTFYGPPPSFGPPPQQTSYGPPPQDTSFGPPPQQTFYGPPPSFGPPPQQTSYGPPPQDTFHDPPPQQIFNGPPPPQTIYGPPPQQTFYGPPPSFGPSPQQTSYGPSPQQTFPDPPSQQTFNGPPPQQNIYGPVVGPQLQPMYGPSVQPQLQPMYGPAVPPQLQTTYGAFLYPQMVVADKEAEKKRAEVHTALYLATLGDNFNTICRILSDKQVTVIDKITDNGNTALHVAVTNSKDPGFLESMFDRIPEDTQLLDVRNIDGSTLLHVAATVGNTEAARILLERNLDLLFAEDKEGHTALALAFSNKHTEMSEQLLKYVTSNISKGRQIPGTSGEDLLVSAISSKKIDLAKQVLENFWSFKTDAVVMAVVQNFPCHPGTFVRYLGTHSKNQFRGSAMAKMALRCTPLCGSWVQFFFWKLHCGINCISMLLWMIPMNLARPFIHERVQYYNDCRDLLGSVCYRIQTYDYKTNSPHLYANPVFEATRRNLYEVVKEIVSSCVDAIWITNEDGHNIMQCAVIARSEKVYNLLHGISKHNHFFRTAKDSCENNILHLAARLAPSSKLNLISGAALQIQRELQWFQEVERFVSPLSITQKNAFDETPRMVFTREHKDLVIEGEKWMKATAESYTITAALITTIVFAAAITVPGGNNQDTGLPVFTNHAAFAIFAISDAISLFGAVTSLLMFLSILTARFAEQDFLFKLPTKLIIGLTTLFISTAAMIVAFGATLYLVFAQSKLRILIPIVVLTCLPIISFVTLQFPLIKDFMSATWGRSIFGKKRDRHFD